MSGIRFVGTPPTQLLLFGNEVWACFDFSDGAWQETDAFSYREMRALGTVLKMAQGWMKDLGETEDQK